MISRDRTYQLTQKVKEKVQNDILEILEFHIKQAANKGATHVVHDFILNDGENTGINDWSEIINIGEFIVENLHGAGFDADYLGYWGKNDKRIKIQVYWGSESEEEYLPLDLEWEDR